MSGAIEQLPSQSQSANPVWAALTLAVAWLVPGGGFLINGRIARGAVLFLILNLTFILGAILDGGVVWPAWSLRDPGFNIVNNLSFIIQLGAGLPAVLSLAAGLGAGNLPVWLAADASSSLFDLSGFYLLVAGAMNYFVVCSTYDHLFGALSRAQEDNPLGAD
jgi:hypothetical protein